MKNEQLLVEDSQEEFENAKFGVGVTGIFSEKKFDEELREQVLREHLREHFKKLEKNI